MNVFALLLASLQITLTNPTPKEFRHSPDQPVVVTFHENLWEMPEVCGIPTDLKVYGCYIPGTNEIHVLNPCYFPEEGNVDSFARLMCHENAHYNGWRH